MQLRFGFTLVILIVTFPAVAQLGFTAPSPLNANASTDSNGDYERAVVKSDGNGNWVAVWESRDTLGGTIGRDPDILVARSSGNAKNWTTPIALNTNATTDSSEDRTPVIATDGNGNWVAVWWSDDSLGGTIQFDWDILVARSTDNGATWTDPAPLNSDATEISASDAVPTIATDGEGNWVCVWEAEHPNGGQYGIDFDLFVARSTDNGETWSELAPLNTNAETDSGSDYVPSLTTDKAGNWVVVWWSRDWLEGTIGFDEDILVSRSTNNGATWTDPAPLNSEATTDYISLFEYTADFNPAVVTDGNGNWVTVWHTEIGQSVGGPDSDILVSRSTDNGETWSDQKHLNTNALTDQSGDTYPMLATDNQGTWVTVWTSTDSLGGTIGNDFDVLVAHSTDNGATWTDPAPLNSTAATDDAYDAYPTIASDGGGHWVAAWESKNSLGGTIAKDSDILLALSPLPTGTLKLLTPTGGEKWKVGKRHEIQWFSTGNPGAEVSIELWRKGVFVEEIKALTPNDGAAKWRVPNSIDPGRGYSARITSVSDTSITDESDAGFRIKPAK